MVKKRFRCNSLESCTNFDQQICAISGFNMQKTRLLDLLFAKKWFLSLEKLEKLITHVNLKPEKRSARLVVHTGY